MTYYMTYEISLALIYNCILNLMNKTGFQVDSQSRLRSRLRKMEPNRAEKVDLSRFIWSFPHPYRQTLKYAY